MESYRRAVVSYWLTDLCAGLLVIDKKTVTGFEKFNFALIFQMNFKKNIRIGRKHSMVACFIHVTPACVSNSC